MSKHHKRSGKGAEEENYADERQEAPETEQQQGQEPQKEQQEPSGFTQEGQPEQDALSPESLAALGFTRKGRSLWHHASMDGIQLIERVPGEYLIYLQHSNSALGKPLTTATQVKDLARIVYQTELG